MRKIIKSELLKCFWGKMIYICSAIIMFLTVLDYTLTRILSTLNMEEVNEITAKITNVSSQEYIVNSLLSLFSGGSIFIIATLLVSSLMCEDYRNGTMKYSLLAVSKEKLILGKIVTVGIINMIYMAAGLFSSSIIGLTAFRWNKNSYSIMQIIGVFLLCWLTIYGFTCLVIFATNKITKVSGVVGVGLGIYFVIFILKVVIPESYSFMVIVGNIDKLLIMNVTSWLEVTATGLVYVIIFTLLSEIAFRKKEILF